jgi:DNA-binding MarR family transcriptional regulator
MMYLWEIGRGSARDLSRALLLDPSTLTPILKKLEQKGYLARTRDPEDERSLIITLTDRGAALQDAALSVPEQMGGCIGLSEGEAEQLGTLIHKVLTNIEKEL